MKRIAVYLDWENLWIPHVKLAFPHLHRGNKSVPAAKATAEEQSLLYELPNLIAQRISTSSLASSPRFSKAFAVWENLDYGQELMPRLRQAGINPIQSLGKIYHSSGKKTIKEASDRALILKVVEDVMLRPHSKLDAIVLGTGDFGFVPLIEFIMEHTDLEVFITSFTTSLSTPLSEMVVTAFSPDHVLKIDEFPAFKEFMERCNGARSVQAKPPAPIGPLPLPIPHQDETEFSKSPFMHLLVLGLKRTKMKYVSRRILETQWIKKWSKDNVIPGVGTELIERAFQIGCIEIRDENIDGRTVKTVSLNLTSDVVQQILASAEQDPKPQEPCA